MSKVGCGYLVLDNLRRREILSSAGLRVERVETVGGEKKCGKVVEVVHGEEEVGEEEEEECLN